MSNLAAYTKQSKIAAVKRLLLNRRFGLAPLIALTVSIPLVLGALLAPEMKLTDFTELATGLGILWLPVAATSLISWWYSRR